MRQPQPRFLRRAVAFYQRHGIRVERVLTDNGSAYRSGMHLLACTALGIRHLRTRPLPAADKRESRTIHPHHAQQRAYGAIYGSSNER